MALGDLAKQWINDHHDSGSWCGEGLLWRTSQEAIHDLEELQAALAKAEDDNKVWAEGAAKWYEERKQLEANVAVLVEALRCIEIGLTAQTAEAYKYIAREAIAKVKGGG